VRLILIFKNNTNITFIMSRSVSRTQDILIESLQKFYKMNGNIKKVINIIEGKENISLRVIDWFVTNYSKKNNVSYMVDEQQFIVYLNYKQQLKGYSKKLFDPFCRRDRINFYYDNTHFIKTTIGQLNFFKWAINNNILDYIRDNTKIIEDDMNKSYKENYKYNKKGGVRKKRQEISVSATKSVSRHNIKITVSFD
jgi:hypothetical protein